MARRRTPIGGDLGALSGRLGQLVGALREAAEDIAARKAEAGESPLQTHVEFAVRGLGEGTEPAAAQRFTRRPAPARPQAVAPLVELFEEADAVLVVIEAPGCAEADVSVSLDAGRLRVSAHGAAAEIAAPAHLHLDLAQAARRFANGVLTLRFPKESS